MTPKEVANAWHSVKEEWFVRRNKVHDYKQWEVVHNWGGDLISDNTMKVISRHDAHDLAEHKAKQLENEARGSAVLAALSRT